MTSLWMHGYAPFLAAIGLLFAIGILEGLALLLGLSVSEQAGSFLVTHFDLNHADADVEIGAFGRFLGWLHVGRVPVLVLLTLLLLGFAMIGFLLQSALHAMAGFTLPPVAAAVLAACGALPFVRRAGAVIARSLPQVESSATSEREFIGRAARIVGGDASVGNAAEARFVDEFGQPHYLRVEPDVAGTTLVRGTIVLIVSRVSGSLYRAIYHPHQELM